MAESFSVLQARCTPEVAAAVGRAKQRQGVTPSEYIRQAVLERLERDGIEAAPIQPRDAGALYDSVEGQQRYAWVEAGEIKAVAYSTEKPAEGWLPIVHFDSAPFDAAQHWRLAPVYSIEVDKVTCTYPIIVKSLEAM